MTRPATARAIGAAAALLGLGCETPAATVPTAPTASSSAVVEPPVVDPGVFASKRFGMKLRLPRSAGWKIDDTRNKWLVASHPAEGSTLLVRLWGGENRMSRDKCEEQARGMRTLPLRGGADIVEDRVVDVPPGFDTHAEVGLVSKEDGRRFGFILAFGGLKRRCYAYVYVTEASGPNADVVVGERLAEMMESSLVTSRFESDLDAVLQREGAEPLPLPPPQR